MPGHGLDSIISDSDSDSDSDSASDSDSESRRLLSDSKFGGSGMCYLVGLRVIPIHNIKICTRDINEVKKEGAVGSCLYNQFMVSRSVFEIRRKTIN